MTKTIEIMRGKALLQGEPDQKKIIVLCTNDNTYKKLLALLKRSM